MTQQFLFIDGSYMVFYRYYAIHQWWKNAHPDEEIGTPIENETFVSTFKNSFIKKIKELEKKLKLKNHITMVGKDCPRKNIWRMTDFDEYKGNRDDDEFEGGPFFKMVYDELFGACGITTILSYDNLEADDCIAITTKEVLKKYPDAEIYIVTSDMDYLQLMRDNVHIYNLKYKLLSESKNAFPDPEKNLFCKIVIGDKSDNIPGIFTKCGIKTAEKYFENRELFHDKLKKENRTEQYEKNRRIIDFDYIPEDLVNGFKKHVLRL